MTGETISEITSQYVNTRDNMAKSKTTFVHINKLAEFNDMVNGYAQRVANDLPPMSLAQWEGFSELVYSYLNEMRSRQTRKPLGNL